MSDVFDVSLPGFTPDFNCLRVRGTAQTNQTRTTFHLKRCVFYYTGSLRIAQRYSSRLMSCGPYAQDVFTLGGGVVTTGGQPQASRPIVVGFIRRISEATVFGAIRRRNVSHVWQVSRAVP